MRWNLPVPKINSHTPQKIKNLCDYPEVMTPDELAEYLRISKRTIYNRRNSGGALPPEMGISKSKLRFSRKAVQKWLDAGCPLGDNRRA